MNFRSIFLALSFVFAVAGFHSQASAQGQEPVLALPELTPSAPEALPTLSLHGGLYVEYYRPNQSWADEDFELHYAYLLMDSTYQDWGVRLEGRFRETPYEEYYASNVWFQESYIYYRQPMYIFKIGKEYSHFGRFWDGSMYGNVLAFDGLKLSPDAGFSFEGKLNEYKTFGMNYFLQYFPTDGQTNMSQDGLHSGATIIGADIDNSNACTQDGICYERTGRDTITIDGADRRNEIIGRIEPNFKIDDGLLTLGISYMFLLADMTTLPPPPNASAGIQPGRYNVHRYEVDVTYTKGPFTIFFEADHQHGQTVLDYPDVGNPSQKIDYYWAGVSYKTGRWTLYYNYSQGNYRPFDTQNVYDIVQVPGFVYDINKYAQFIFEYGYAYRLGSVIGNNPSGFYMNDNSCNFYLKASI